MVSITGFRASPQQVAAWQQIAASTRHPYGVHLQIYIDGAIDVPTIAARLRDLAKCEEILRTRLVAAPGVAWPIQVIEHEMQVRFTEEDLCLLDGSQQQSRLAHHCELRRSWQLPFEITLSKLSNTRLAVTLSAQCTHADLVTLQVLADRLLTGTTEVTPQYADYAEWKHSVSEGDAHHPGVEFWHAQTIEKIALPRLALEIATPDVFQPVAIDLPLRANLVTELSQLASATGRELRELLLAAWSMLLARLSGQSDLPLAIVDDGRSEELGGALGSYEQVLPFRASIPQTLALGAQIDAIAQQMRVTLGWRDYYQGEAADDYAFAYRELMPAVAATAVIYAINHRFKAQLAILDRGGRLDCHLLYDRCVLSGDAAACLGEQWHTLLEALLRDREQALGAIALLSDRQLARITPSAPPPLITPRSVVELIERQVSLHGTAPAVTDSAATLSYDALNAHANQLAHRLRTAGVHVGQPVGILLPRSNHMIVAILAVLKVGAAYVPLDPTYPVARLDAMVQDSGVQYLICGDDVFGRAMAIPNRITLPLDDTGDDIGAGSTANLDLTLDLSSPAYLIYTSGSAGQPKAVEISHYALSHSTQVRAAFYDEAVGAYLLLSSFAFDSSVAGIFWTLVQGGRLVLPARGEELALDRLATLIARHRITHGLSLPSLYESLLDYASSEQLSSLETWIVAGEPCPSAVLSKHERKVPAARLVNEYGPTEATVWATADVLENTRAVTIGRPIPTMELVLLNDHGIPATLSEPGEIYLGGPTLARGYRGKLQQTAEAFVNLPQAGGRRFYRTGDLACWDVDGRLHFLGRKDLQVKIRGHRVELGEIERALRLHPQIREAAVIAQEHAGSKRLLAYIIGAHGYAPRPEAIRDFVTDKFPAYMVPAAIVALESFPRTPNGKLDVAALPDPDAMRRAQHVEPRNEVESTLATVVAGVLRLPRVGVLENFFEIGGDSILSLQVVTRAMQRGLRITAKQIFDCQTVARLADIAERIDHEPTDSENFSATGISADELQTLLTELTEANDE